MAALLLTVCSMFPNTGRSQVLRTMEAASGQQNYSIIQENNSNAGNDFLQTTAARYSSIKAIMKSAGGAFIGKEELGLDYDPPPLPKEITQEFLLSPHPYHQRTIASCSVIAFDEVSRAWHMVDLYILPGSKGMRTTAQDVDLLEKDFDQNSVQGLTLEIPKDSLLFKRIIDKVIELGLTRELPFKNISACTADTKNAPPGSCVVIGHSTTHGTNIHCAHTRHLGSCDVGFATSWKLPYSTSTDNQETQTKTQIPQNKKASVNVLGRKDLSLQINIPPIPAEYDEDLFSRPNPLHPEQTIGESCTLAFNEELYQWNLIDNNSLRAAYSLDSRAGVKVIEQDSEQNLKILIKDKNESFHKIASTIEELITRTAAAKSMVKVFIGKEELGLDFNLPPLPKSITKELLASPDPLEPDKTIGETSAIVFDLESYSWQMPRISAIPGSWDPLNKGLKASEQYKLLAGICIQGVALEAPDDALHFKRLVDAIAKHDPAGEKPFANMFVRTADTKNAQSDCSTIVGHTDQYGAKMSGYLRAEQPFRNIGLAGQWNIGETLTTRTTQANPDSETLAHEEPWQCTLVRRCGGVVLGKKELKISGQIPPVPKEFSYEFLTSEHPLRPGKTIAESCALGFYPEHNKWYLIELDIIPGSLGLYAYDQYRLLDGIEIRGLRLKSPRDSEPFRQIVDKIIHSELSPVLPFHEKYARTAEKNTSLGQKTGHFVIVSRYKDEKVRGLRQYDTLDNAFDHIGLAAQWEVPQPATEAEKIAAADRLASIPALMQETSMAKVMEAQGSCLIGPKELGLEREAPPLPEWINTKFLLSPHPLCPGETVASASVIIFDDETNGWYQIERSAVPGSFGLKGKDQDKLIAGVKVEEVELVSPRDSELLTRLLKIAAQYNAIDKSMLVKGVQLRTAECDLSDSTMRYVVNLSGQEPQIIEDCSTSKYSEQIGLAACWKLGEMSLSSRQCREVKQFIELYKEALNSSEFSSLTEAQRHVLSAIANEKLQGIISCATEFTSGREELLALREVAAADQTKFGRYDLDSQHPEFFRVVSEEQIKDLPRDKRILMQVKLDSNIGTAAALSEVQKLERYLKEFSLRIEDPEANPLTDKQKDYFRQIIAKIRINGIVAWRKSYEKDWVTFRSVKELANELYRVAASDGFAYSGYQYPRGNLRDRFRVLSRNQIEKMGASDIQWLSAAEVGYCFEEQGQYLSEEQKALLNRQKEVYEDLQKYRQEIFEIEGNSRFAGLTELQKYLLADLLTKVDNYTADRKFTPERSRNVLANYCNIALMTPEAAREKILTVGEDNGYAIQLITPNQIQTFQKEHIRSLSPKKLSYLFPEQLEAFTRDQLSYFSPEQLNYLYQKTDYLEKTEEYFNELDKKAKGHVQTSLEPAQKQALAEIIQETRKRMLAAEITAKGAYDYVWFIAWLAENSAATLHTLDIHDDPRNFFRVYGSKQIRALTGDQIKSLSRIQLNEFSDEQKSYFTRQQLNYLPYDIRSEIQRKRSASSRNTRGTVTENTRNYFRYSPRASYNSFNRSLPSQAKAQGNYYIPSEKGHYPGRLIRAAEHDKLVDFLQRAESQGIKVTIFTLQHRTYNKRYIFRFWRNGREIREILVGENYHGKVQDTLTGLLK